MALQREEKLQNIKKHELEKLQEEDDKGKQVDLIRMLACPFATKKLVR